LIEGHGVAFDSGVFEEFFESGFEFGDFGGVGGIEDEIMVFIGILFEIV